MAPEINLFIYRDKGDERDNPQTNNLLNADKIGSIRISADLKPKKCL